MQLRSGRERAVQTLSYEAGGIFLVSPGYMLIFGTDAHSTFTLMVAMSLAVLLWSPLHNVVFDLAEWRLAQRVASDRPHRWRLVHAFSHESSTVVVTLPVIMLIGGHGFWAGLAVDFGLTLFYTAYAYVFYWAFDRLRPVKAPESS